MTVNICTKGIIFKSFKCNREMSSLASLFTIFCNSYLLRDRCLVSTDVTQHNTYYYDTEINELLAAEVRKLRLWFCTRIRCDFVGDFRKSWSWQSFHLHRSLLRAKRALAFFRIRTPEVLLEGVSEISHVIRVQERIQRRIHVRKHDERVHQPNGHFALAAESLDTVHRVQGYPAYHEEHNDDGQVFRRSDLPLARLLGTIPGCTFGGLQPSVQLQASFGAGRRTTCASAIRVSG